MTEPTTVVYILGTPRSGSTLVTRLLGDHPGVFAAGEVRLLWKDYPDRTCGCGAKAQDCEVWGEVLRRLSAREVFPPQVRDRFSASSRMSRLPQILSARTLAELPEASRWHADVLGATYAALRETTGATTIVDSSKSVAEAALLAWIPGLRVRLIHVVRDPRAVAHSWHRAVATGAIGTPPRASWSIALRWLLTNSASEAVTRRHPGSTMRLRYEDVVDEPQTRIRDAVERLGLSRPTGVPIPGGHIVGGNRLRHVAVRPKVTPDEEWRTRLAATEAAEVAGLTWPLLRRYAYALRVTP